MRRGVEGTAPYLKKIEAVNNYTPLKGRTVCVLFCLVRGYRTMPSSNKG